MATAMKWFLRLSGAVLLVDALMVAVGALHLWRVSIVAVLFIAGVALIEWSGSA